MSMQSKRSIGEKVAACFRRMFSCCGRQDEAEYDLSAIKIGAPTDFRREEIRLPGMTPSQERFVREKAAEDAKRVWRNLQPLHSSPSGTFAERPATSSMPTYEQFTQPRAAPAPRTSFTNSLSQTGRLDRVRAHGRKISDTFKNRTSSGGPSYKAVESPHADRHSGNEAKGLIDPDRTRTGSLEKSPMVDGSRMSQESWQGTEHSRDRDSGKGGIDVRP